MFRSIVIVASLALTSQPALACIEYRFDSDESDILSADAIFVGRLIDYEIITFGGDLDQEDAAVLTYEVDQVLKGKLGGEVTLYWENYAFAYPDSASSFVEIVGVQSPYPKQPEDFWNLAQVPNLTAIRSEPRIFRPLCGASITIVGTDANVENVASWIAKGAADDAVLEETAGSVEEVTARRTVPVNFTYLIVTIAALTLLGSAAAAFNRRQSP